MELVQVTSTRYNVCAYIRSSQYTGGPSVQWGLSRVHWGCYHGVHWGFDTLEGYLECTGGRVSILEAIMMPCGVILSKLGVVQYIGGGGGDQSTLFRTMCCIEYPPMYRR